MKRYDPQLVALSTYHAVNDGSLAVFLAVLPVMRVALGLSLVQIGTILSAGILGTVVMQLVFGYLADVRSSRSLLTGGLISIAIVDLAFVRGDGYLQVLILYVLLRAAAGVYHPVSFSTVFRTATNRSAALGFQSAFGDASLAFGMFSMGFVAESYGWQTPFLLWGSVGLLGFLAFVSLMRSPLIERTAQPPRDSLDSDRSGITRGYVILQFATAFMQCLFIVFSSYLPLFLNVNLQLSPGVSSSVVALWLGIGVASSFNAGRWVSVFGSERRAARVCFGLTTLLLAAGTLMVIRQELRIIGLTLLVLSGGTFFPVFPIMYGVVGVAAPKNRLGLAYATNLSLSLTAGSFASFGVGYLASAYTLVVVLPIVVSLAILASLMVTVL